jgi:SAM-dependent methyltransferase
VREELGDVAGKDLLHLQCHFGLDTLGWARLGAWVTGADFSERAIAQARALAAETGLDATFIVSDVADLPAALEGDFDLVFTSFGVLGWLPDVPRWADVVAHFVRPGGRFYIAEAHPFAQVFDDGQAATEPRLRYDCWHSPGPGCGSSSCTGSPSPPGRCTPSWSRSSPTPGGCRRRSTGGCRSRSRSRRRRRRVEGVVRGGTAR